jgi:hypothetical protein
MAKIKMGKRDIVFEMVGLIRAWYLADNSTTPESHR